MAIKRADIKNILPDIEDGAMKSLMALIHTETDSIKDELDTARADLKAAQTAQQKAESERDKAVNDLTEYKDTAAKKDAYSAKEAAYKAILKAEGVAEKYIDKVCRRSKDEINALELDDSGKVKGVKSVKDAIKAEWGEYVTTTTTEGQKVENPPANTGNRMTLKEIMSIKDTTERQAAMAANPEAVGLSEKG